MIASTFPLVFLIALVVCVATAFQPMGIVTKRSTLYMRRGRGSGLKRELDDSSSPSGFTGGASNNNNNKQWLNTGKSIKELPTEEGKVRTKRDEKKNIATPKFSRQIRLQSAHCNMQFILLLVLVVPLVLRQAFFGGVCCRISVFGLELFF